MSSEGDNPMDQQNAGVFWRAGFLGIRRVRHIEAAWHAHTVHPGMEHSASRATAFTRAKTAAASAANAAPLTGADATPTTWPVRHVHGCGHGIAKIRKIGIGHFQVRRPKERGIHREL